MDYELFVNAFGEDEDGNITNIQPEPVVDGRIQTVLEALGNLSYASEEDEYIYYAGDFTELNISPLLELIEEYGLSMKLII